MTRRYVRQSSGWRDRDRVFGVVPATVVTYAHPSGAPSASGWGVTVDGAATWVHSTPWGSSDIQRLATYSTDAAADVAIVVTTPLAVTSATVHAYDVSSLGTAGQPVRLSITPTTGTGEVGFTLPSGFLGHVTVEVNGLTTNQLLISALPIESTVNPGDFTHYYGPGYHPGVGEIALQSGQSLYIAGGALVEGKLRVGPTVRTGTVADGVTVRGRGVLDSAAYTVDPGRVARVQAARNVTIEGLALLNVSHWGCVTYESQDVTWSWVRIISKRDGTDVGTPDGFDALGSTRVTLRDAFIRSYDDAIATKATKNGWYGNSSTTLAERVVIVQGDGGNAMELGYENGTYTISGVTYRRIAVTRKSSRAPSDYYRRAAIGLHVTGSGAISDVLYEDILVHSTAENQMWIGNCGTGSAQDGTGTTTGTAPISGVTLRRVAFPSNSLPYILTAGSGSLDDVLIQGCTEGGTPITSTAGMTVTNATNVRFA